MTHRFSTRRAQSGSCWLLLLLLLSCADAYGQRQRRMACESGGVSVEITLRGERITAFSLSSYRRVNRSMHECGVSAARDETESTWEDTGHVTTITFAEHRGRIIIERRADETYTVTLRNMDDAGLCGAGASFPRRVTISRRGRRYVCRSAQ